MLIDHILDGKPLVHPHREKLLGESAPQEDCMAISKQAAGKE